MYQYNEISSEGLKKKCQVVIPADLLKKEFVTGVMHYKQSVNINGFRKGKAPNNFIIKQYGKEIFKSMYQRLMEDSYRNFMNQNTNIISSQVSNEKISQDIEQPFTYEITYETFPELANIDIKAIEISSYEVSSISEDDIANHKKEIQKENEDKNDDELKDILGIDKEKSLDEHCKEDLEEICNIRKEFIIKHSIMSHLNKTLDFEIPDIFFQNEKKSLLEELKKDGKEKSDEEITELVTYKIKNAVILFSISKQESLVPIDAEIVKNEIINFYINSGNIEGLQEIIKDIQDGKIDNRIYKHFEARIIEDKALEYLMNNVTVIEKHQVTLDELKEKVESLEE
ncbi:MAG: trigger factor family protein [Anaplasmataceae bacterium]|nr:trigger factor family protein [Candidatus Heimdallarchaeota archaeon]MDH5796576.1 trigger factor family protein [Anaplasmataceae bacterium]